MDAPNVLDGDPKDGAVLDVVVPNPPKEEVGLFCPNILLPVVLDWPKVEPVVPEGDLNDEKEFPEPKAEPELFWPNAPDVLLLAVCPNGELVVPVLEPKALPDVCPNGDELLVDPKVEPNPPVLLL